MDVTQVKLTKLYVKHKPSFTWLKYVRGIDLSQHCARSLVGDYEMRWKRFGYPRIPYFGLVLPESPFYYFCAVTNNWEDNAHVAWMASAGDILEVDNEQVHIIVENAKALPISKEYIDWDLPHANEESYNTCRNWWFANYLAKEYFNNTKENV